MMKMIKLDKEEFNLKIFNFLKLKKNRYFKLIYKYQKLRELQIL